MMTSVPGAVAGVPNLAIFTPPGPDGKVDAGYVQWRRLQADALKWELSKLEPKRFGEKLELDGQLSHKVEKVVREVIDPK